MTRFVIYAAHTEHDSSVEALTTSNGLVQMSIERGGATVDLDSITAERQYSSTGLGGTHVRTSVQRTRG